MQMNIDREPTTLDVDAEEDDNDGYYDCDGDVVDGCCCCLFIEV